MRRMRSHMHWGVLHTLLLSSVVVVLGPAPVAGAAEPDAPGADAIASHASAAPILAPELLPPSNPGYFRVTTDDGRLAPVYWMPIGTAGSAPPGVQGMLAYRANVTNGIARRSNVIIYSNDAAVVTPAAWYDCPDGWSCLWANNSWTGRMLQFHDPGSWQNMAWYSFNNDASSLYNRKSNRSTWYATEPDGGNPIACLHAGWSWEVLPGGLDNNISSIKIKNDNVC